MGVAHHSSYLLWFELARTGLLRESGHPYGEMERGGTLLPVIEYGCKMIRGAEYDDTLSIETIVAELRSRTVTFRYRVMRDGRVLAEGWTKHLCVDGHNRYMRIPDAIRSAIAPYAAGATDGQAPPLPPAQ